MPTLLLDRNAVKNLMTMGDVIKAVEEAFRLCGEGKGRMPAKVYLSVEHGDFRAMPAALPGCAGVKWVNVHPENRSRGLPSVMAVLIYSDPETGYPLAIMDATEITAYRTGAAAGIASKYLARPDSHTMGVIGAGYQAYTQILAHAELFNPISISAFDVSQAALDALMRSFPQFQIKACSIQEALASDIVCTLTPSRNPIVKKEWISPGTHINAVGADAPGKQELDPAILKAAIVVVDDMKQASGSGEINVPIQKGIYSTGEIYGTLAEVVVGKKKGRANNRDITVFDSTGIAVEDMAVAKFLFEKAQQKGGYPSVDLMGT
ncbi:MAG: ornithine cyclodeaminase family protein [Dehalococcoidia bacterium]|nr:ornithine cyclodeaminase family protein [Dehalococcoidia bacterium]MDH4300271.1 ornithine cyclodeaminase family protein [Dehalococcoidia bacterium]MDH4368001.1 ornithine cyclodeaminase family protein [Dehalococcoidia bacterium]